MHPLTNVHKGPHIDRSEGIWGQTNRHAGLSDPTRRPDASIECRAVDVHNKFAKAGPGSPSVLPHNAKHDQYRIFATVANTVRLQRLGEDEGFVPPRT